MELMHTEAVEKQGLIVNINMMRDLIGVERTNFNFLFKKPVDELRIIQEETIAHYNQAIQNK